VMGRRDGEVGQDAGGGAEGGQDIGIDLARDGPALFLLPGGEGLGAFGAPTPIDAAGRAVVAIEPGLDGHEDIGGRRGGGGRGCDPLRRVRSGRRGIRGGVGRKGARRSDWRRGWLHGNMDAGGQKGKGQNGGGQKGESVWRAIHTGAGIA